MVREEFANLVRPDGRVYKGGWNNGKQHGEAVFVTEEGEEMKGIWKNGQRQKWID